MYDTEKGQSPSVRESKARALGAAIEELHTITQRLEGLKGLICGAPQQVNPSSPTPGAEDFWLLEVLDGGPARIHKAITDQQEIIKQLEDMLL